MMVEKIYCGKEDIGETMRLYMIYRPRVREEEDPKSTYEHVEGMHEDVVLGLENEHEVEGSRDAEGHAVAEGSLTDGVGEEDGSGGGDGSREGHEDPRPHAKAVAQFPFTAHVGHDAEEEMKNDELVLATIVEPLIHRGSFPDGVEMHADGVRGGDDGTADDVVAIQKRPGDGLTDAIDIDGWSGNEGSDEAGGRSKEGGEHESSEPSDVETVLGRGDPVGETLPNDGGILVVGLVLLLDQVGSESSSTELGGEVKGGGLGHIGLRGEGKGRRRRGAERRGALAILESSRGARDGAEGLALRDKEGGDDGEGELHLAWD